VLTVAESIFMGQAPDRRFGFLRVMDWEITFRRVQKVLSELDVYDLNVRYKVGTLNVGNRQRVEIAKALSLNAKLLIMDEPTAALIKTDVEQLFHITRLLRSRGVGIIYISHKLNEVFALADRVTVLRDGQYIGTKAIADTNERG
jgi:rhamnose transport system ATP-binding protein